MLGGGSLESRVSYLEQLIIIIIIGGGGGGGIRPKGDSFSADITRLNALSGLAGSASDLSQATAADIESSLHHLNAELVRLRALETQMNARLKELRK